MLTENQQEEIEFEEKVISVNRVSKVVKGGRRFSFSALVAIGDRNGHVGIGFGKAKEVPIAISKAIANAKKRVFELPLAGDNTLPHHVMGRYGASKILIKPAAPGTGVIAGGPIRIVMELAGIKNVLTKSLGSKNAINVVRATEDGLRRIRSPLEIAKLRGKNLKEFFLPINE
ncbi:MAG: 30S ribosomal protein S5 [Actinomycetia bacterium]|nr:30S ribosomal protein S5 [Actinomycetes bacterium]